MYIDVNVFPERFMFTLDTSTNRYSFSPGVAKEEHFWTLPSKQRMGGLFTTIQAPTLVRLRQKEREKERKSG